MSDDASLAGTINSAMSEPAPELPDPESTTITLLRGFPGVGLEARVRELNGEDEEFIAGIEASPDTAYGEWLSAILGRSVVSVGGSAPSNLNDLINADRDMLMLATVKATYGPVKTVRAICPSCKEKNDIEINLDEDFPIKRPDFDITQPISVKTKKGRILQFNLPTGTDTTLASKAKTDAEANSIILSRCAVFPEGEEPSDRLTWARKLGVAPRQDAERALLAIELGPRLEVVETQCAHCDKEIVLGLDWVSLLLS